MELQQSRIDTTISFVTDFTSLGLKAGDIIDVSSSIYGLTNTKFRIITIRESDTDGGEIQLAITAQLYSDAVYDTTGLTRLIRTSDTGIAGIGNIGLPGVPTVTLSSTNSSPHVTITSSAPSGVVTGMEFHYSTDTDVVYDENRTYNLAGTTTAANGTFAFGETVRFDYYDAPAGNLIVKTRGINSTTVGPFSQPTGNVTYTPKTAAGAITNQTKVLSSTGALITSLGASFLLSQLADLIKGNTASGGLLSTISNALTKKSGAQAGAGGLVLQTTKTYTSTSDFVASTSSALIQKNICPFTPKVNGTYLVRGKLNAAGVGAGGTEFANTFGIVVNENSYHSTSLDSGTTMLNTMTNYLASGPYSAFIQQVNAHGGCFQQSNDFYVSFVAGQTYYLSAVISLNSECDGVFAQFDITNTGLEYGYSPNNNIGKSGTPGYTSPVATELRYTVGDQQYINSAANIAFEQPVGVEAYLNRNFGSGRITFGTDTYNGEVFGGIFQTTIVTEGYDAGTYTPYFEYWDQGIDPDAFSANVSSSLLDITIGEFNPQDEEFTPTDEEVTTDEQDQPAPELPEGDYPEPEYDLTDYGDL
jgi:hypothetical protein